MSRFRRIDLPSADCRPRWTVGLAVGSDCRGVGAALVSAEGRGLEARLAVRAHRVAAVPEETGRLYRQLAARSGTAVSVEAILQLRAELAELESTLVAELASQVEGATDEVLVLGVNDPGLWSATSGEATGYLGLCDAARLAEHTGANVVDALPARDLARHGRGGPIAALAEWMLLAAPGETRVLVDLGRTTRMSLLPARREPAAPTRVLSFDVGPGTELLDTLTRQLTGGAQAFDPGGRLAVQGCCVDDLLDHWLADPFFERPLPRWHPRGVRPERFLNEAIRMAVDAGWSVRDLLCTGTHLIAESISRALRRRLPGDLPPDRIVLAGGGCLNGLLLGELADRLPNVPMAMAQEWGIPSGALDPACVAVLALCHVDQIPANLAAVTGAEVPRVLGRLTPGSPRNWQRIVQQMAAAGPALRTLRSAV